MTYRLTLDDKGIESTVTFDGPSDVRTYATKALDLYQQENPARTDLMIEIDHSVFCQHAGETELYVSRVRFARRPKRDGARPRWGRWHGLIVEKVPS